MVPCSTAAWQWLSSEKGGGSLWVDGSVSRPRDLLVRTKASQQLLDGLFPFHFSVFQSNKILISLLQEEKTVKTKTIDKREKGSKQNKNMIWDNKIRGRKKWVGGSLFGEGRQGNTNRWVSSRRREIYRCKDENKGTGAGPGRDLYYLWSSSKQPGNLNLCCMMCCFNKNRFTVHLKVPVCSYFPTFRSSDLRYKRFLKVF